MEEQAAVTRSAVAQRHTRRDHGTAKTRDVNGTGGMQMLIATTDVIAGGRIVATVGLVLGLAVRSRGIGGNIMAGLHALGDGDALDEYCEELAATRQDALAHLAALAAERGANAVVGVRFDTAEVSHDMREVVAYGTAVVLEQGI
jgi:uncharacterized protein YbjQ (UPF0145 family)